MHNIAFILLTKRKKVNSKENIIIWYCKIVFIITQIEVDCENIVPRCDGWLRKDYENLFLSFLQEEGAEIVILNADCGQMKYQVETRKSV